ncbi:uncharacterized protein LOC115629567 [Scaptodrosophila lebanonensis]|uniref:Uncharacterized protein LOC115629567 n=1 Tax=Drosophila lebanonensis TaxID=7225 RepID=A0A6J2U0N5_DROLE|nr:uncharacterized protein LOC115629567 [Scaptodrosophila lebanonensis]
MPEQRVLRTKLKRKSLSALTLGGKENQLTSTPLPLATCRTPRLKDLSNIMRTPATATASASAITTPKTLPSPWQTPPSTLRAKPPVYASTLPTFEAEYSPSAAVIPGPLLALRGMGIPDSYFEKPRYLEQKPLPLPASTAAQLAEQPTLSSTQMGDVTLERMIDAILESTHKAVPPNPRPRPRQRLRQRQRQRLAATIAVHSPTYRPAYDPASDLCEYWQPSPDADGETYEEREVRSPLPAPHTQSKRRSQSLHLRRQRVVRRKRKIATKISSSVRQSAQKLLAAARSAQKAPRSTQRHISPDSGHNSTSDFEEELVLFGICGAEATTKRRLSFSFHEEPFVDK